ncbi:MAG: hypothetical protein FWD73_06975 [Polyangiaceae bacterium]|nr:hypothetical protein [Polyangiaceae bacterium]
MRKTIMLTAIALVLVVSCEQKKESPPPTAAPFLATIAALPNNPKATAPTSTKTDKESNSTVYAYPDGNGYKSLTLTTASERKGAWKLVVESKGSTITPYSFDPTWTPGAGGASLPTDWFVIVGGPLKGAIVHLHGYIGSFVEPGDKATRAEIFSPPFLLSKAFNFQERQLMLWACDSGKGGVKAPLPASDFIQQCRDGARAKGAVTSVGQDDIFVSVDCEYAAKMKADGLDVLCQASPKTPGSVKVTTAKSAR